MKENTLKSKSSKELKELYKKDYVGKFSESQSIYRLNRLLKYMQLESNFRVVDFACGNGMLFPLVAPLVASYVGVDFSEEFISEANRRKKALGINNAEFYCNEINDFCAKHSKSIDCGFAMDFSEHVYDDDWVKILHSIKKSLKPGGSLYLHTPNSLFFLEQLKERSFLLKQFEEHIAVRTPEENINLLKRARFGVKKVKLIPHYNIFRLIHFVSYIPYVGKYFKARIFIDAVA